MSQEIDMLDREYKTDLCDDINKCNNLRHQIYTKKPNFIMRKLGNEVLLIPIRNNVGDLENVYSLNSVGAYIYEIIDGVKDVSEICKMVSTKCNASEENLEEDIYKFIQELNESLIISCIGSKIN
jgi:hypothetical protein